MKAEEVADYLQQHPEFFEQYADMLAEIYIQHPHGGRAIPISERQILTLREKGKQLENKLREIIQFGEQNDAIGEKMHRITCVTWTGRFSRRRWRSWPVVSSCSIAPCTTPRTR